MSSSLAICCFAGLPLAQLSGHAGQRQVSPKERRNAWALVGFGMKLGTSECATQECVIDLLFPTLCLILDSAARSIEV
jgi:hypothetical protein